jgi:8-oxo-dGTP pyrophosphatase MutT (NUDIX family)
MSGPSDLETLVRGYAPDGDAWSHEMALGVISNERPMWSRSEFDPGHFTASAFVVSPDGASLLLIHHAKLDRWLQPGGHIEADDDTVEVAARREVLEETGVAALTRVGESLVRIDAHEIPERGTEPAHLHLDLGLGFVAQNLEIGPITEVLDAKWVPMGDLQMFGADDALLAGAEAVRCLYG